MVLPSPGQTISLSQVRNEFGLGNPISMSQVRGRGSNVPSSGSMSMSGSLGGKSSYLKVRWVRLRLTNNGFMHINEIFVIDHTGQNVALGKGVTMSDPPANNDNNLAGWRAVDNDLESGTHGTVQFSYPAWIEVDLGAEYWIYRVNIANRRSDFDYCGGRILGAVIDLKNGAGTSVYVSNRFHAPSGNNNWTEQYGGAYYNYEVRPPDVGVNGYN
jgi:F5/8 type C domain-containing protein